MCGWWNMGAQWKEPTLTPEAKVKKKISALLRKHGVWYTMPIQRGFTKPGVPDYLCLLHGMFFTIEAKAGTNKPTQAQLNEMQAIRDNGGFTFVVNETNLSELEDLLSSLTV